MLKYCCVIEHLQLGTCIFVCRLSYMFFFCSFTSRFALKMPALSSICRHFQLHSKHGIES